MYLTGGDWKVTTLLAELFTSTRDIRAEHCTHFTVNICVVVIPLMDAQCVLEYYN